MFHRTAHIENTQAGKASKQRSGIEVLTKTTTSLALIVIITFAVRFNRFSKNLAIKVQKPLKKSTKMKATKQQQITYFNKKNKLSGPKNKKNNQQE